VTSPLDRAAREAAALVADGARVGLGTGQAAEAFLLALAARVRGGLAVVGVPTSEETARVAARVGVPLGDLAGGDLDLTVDGADEVELESFALIKGRGGALLREKLVALASGRVVIIADASKVVPRLGARYAVPVEVVTFGWRHTARALERLGAAVTPREVPGDFYVTDGGNFILDCAFGPIPDPPALAARLKSLPGVVEHGLFIGLAHTAIIAGPDGVTKYEVRMTNGD
jgi:ribose 5-phosphate isomerase A